MHFFGTIFWGGLIHIWCSNECLWHQDSVCVYGNEGACRQSSSVAHWCVFNSFWTTVKLNGSEEADLSGCDTNRTVSRYIQSVFLTGFVNNKMRKYKISSDLFDTNWCQHVKLPTLAVFFIFSIILNIVKIARWSLDIGLLCCLKLPALLSTPRNTSWLKLQLTQSNMCITFVFQTPDWTESFHQF